MTKMFYGNQYIGKFNCNGEKYTKWQLRRLKIKRFVFKIVLVIIALDVIGWAGVAGYHYAKGTILPETVWAEKTVEVPVDSDAPVMDRIAKCESGGTHMKNGQVVINVNTNKTYDQGIFQINSIWNKKAADLGYNLLVEKDNIAFAMWLYKNYGTEPWYSSKICWSK